MKCLWWCWISVVVILISLTHFAREISIGNGADDCKGAKKKKVFVFSRVRFWSFRHGKVLVEQGRE